ncbi:hypothetical protein D3C81_1976150 [compost metagenome]
MIELLGNRGGVSRHHLVGFHQLDFAAIGFRLEENPAARQQRQQEYQEGETPDSGVRGKR